MNTLIFDRTKEDVAQALAIRAKYQTIGSWTGLTSEETAQLERGMLTTVTLNRVSSAIAQLVSELREIGYVADAGIPTYTASDTFTRSQIINYLSAVAAVRAAFPTSVETPEAPTIDRWIDHNTANDIERIVWEVSHTVAGAKAITRVCGTFSAGDNYIMQIIRRG